MRIEKRLKHKLAYNFNNKQANIAIPQRAQFDVEKYIDAVEYIDEGVNTIVFTRFAELPMVYERLADGWQKVDFHAWKRRRKDSILVDDE